MADRTPPPARPARAAAASGSPRRGWAAGALIALIAVLLLVVGALALSGGGEDPASEPNAREEPTATATPTATETPEETATPEATATEEPTAEPTEEPTQEPTAEPQQPAATGDDPTELQLEAYELNRAGRHDEALPVAARAVELCEGSNAINPCAYALFEYGRALRLTGDPESAIAVLEERKQRFPGDQPQAVNAELKLARQAARGGGDD